MARIVILCEGDTEELAVRQFVSRQWLKDGFHHVGLKTINLHGRLQDVCVKARLFLDEDDVRAVFTLVDLYGMDRVRHQPTDVLEQKVRRVCDWLRCDVIHRRSDHFFAHVSVHETEAWILAEGSALAKRLSDAQIRADPTAELVNFDRPPSKRMNDLFLSRRPADRYKKIIDGRPLFAEMQFDPVYKACGYFRKFYDDLKSVASIA